MQSPDRKGRWQDRRAGQGLVEFMLILPVMLLLILGIIELGRMFLILSEATSASREASRYGASVGSDGAGGLRYLDCAGMRAAARRMFALSTVPDSAITVAWDHGSPDQTFASCPTPPSRGDVEPGDRVVVRVTLLYSPIVPLVPLPQIPIVSETARTILIDIAAGPTVTLGGPVVTDTDTPFIPTSTYASTPTPSETPAGPTATASETPVPPPTDTPGPTNTPRPTPTPIPAPSNFGAAVTCTNGAVQFTWDAVTGAHYYAVYEVTTPPPDMMACLTNRNRCDYAYIPLDGVVHTFYVVAYVDSSHSVASNLQALSCPPPG
jgi:Flp pilus assembly protein TadG